MPFDAGIPVLTEVLKKEIAPVPAPTLPDGPLKPAVWRTGAAASTAASTAAPVPAAAPEIAPSPAHAAPAVPGKPEEPEEPDDADDEPAAGYVDLVERVMVAAPVEQAADTGFAALERALSERILQQLMPRVDALVAERLEGVLQQFAAGLRAGLGESIAQAVAASVQQELASLRAQKR
jgi:hypothetical protein